MEYGVSSKEAISFSRDVRTRKGASLPRGLRFDNLIKDITSYLILYHRLQIPA